MATYPPSGIKFLSASGHRISYRSAFCGSSFLVGARGESSTITIKENSGRHIREVRYHGESLIVLTGETTYCSYPSGVIWDRTDAMVQDWRAGTWTPDNGIKIDHPRSITLANATLCVMTFEHASSDPVFALTLAIVELLRNRKRQVRRLGGGRSVQAAS